MWNLDEYCKLIFNSVRLRPLLWIFLSLGRCFETQARLRYWLKSVPWPVGPVLELAILRTVYRWKPIKIKLADSFFPWVTLYWSTLMSFKFYLSVLFPTYFTSFPRKVMWTTAFESVGSVSACSVVETRVAFTLVYVCKTEWYQSTCQN